jgi:cysteine desulfurase
MHANNEVGTRNDLQAIGTLCRRHQALFHSDTVQTMGHYRFDLATQLPLDISPAPAHKFHGPKGVGFLYMREGTGLKPMIQGGAQERNMRAVRRTWPASWAWPLPSTWPTRTWRSTSGISAA